ncbi:MAG: hypothetical protein JJE47_04795 [Acidimicrobiia bacterium]|nr:hypothetical protein [Acidimicrobiia bacterium]
MAGLTTIRHRFLIPAIVLGPAVIACEADAEPAPEVATLDTLDPAGTVLGAIVDQELELLDFSECMRAEGIDIGDPTIDANGNASIGTPMNTISDHGSLMAAYNVCDDFIGSRPLGHGGEDRTAVHDRLVNFAKCVRDNGYYDLPDPDFSGASGDIFPGLDRQNPDSRAAEQVCEELLVVGADQG